MPSNWSMVDNNFPTFTGEEPVRSQIGKLVNYMMVLTDQLKYNLANLDTTNWNETAMSQFQADTTQDVESDVEDLDGTVEETNQSLSVVKLAVEDMAQALLELQEKIDKWEEEQIPKINNLEQDMEKQKTVIVPDGSGGAAIGNEGQELRLVGKVYINGVLVE